jgi:WD40 repeat protein
MARPNYGPQAKQRTKCLLEVLLAYANDELEDCEHFQIQTHWQMDNQLVVRTKIRFLEELSAKDPYNGKLNHEHIKEALKRLEDFLEILEDNRTTTKGSEDWHFTLKLWHRRHDQAANLKQFDLEWERRRPQKSKQVAGEAGGSQLLGNTLSSNPSVSSIQNLKSKIQNRTDWGEAVDVSIFYGRQEELATLERWIVQDHCRLVMLLGMGGIGKTALSVKLAEQIQDQFESLIWRSLRNAPPLKELLSELILFLSNQQETNLPETVDAQVSRLIHYLRSCRCLLVLDNVEAILHSGECAGHYRAGYEGYGELIRRVGEERHQSCLVLTGRERPRELASLEGNTLPVRLFQLTGLREPEAAEILNVKGLLGAAEETRQLIACYRGNPLALKIVATSIRELFEGDISEFLAQGTAVFNGIRNLLDQQFNRLSELERQIMYWLAINREPVSVAELQADIVPPVSTPKLLEALESLRGRTLVERAAPTLVERSTVGFTQQPVVMEYVADQFIEQISEEIKTGEVRLFRSHALLKAQTKDYVRETQVRLILKPVIDQLLCTLRSRRNIENQLTQIVSMQQKKSPLEPGYVAGNVLNLLCELQADLSNRDFSHLTVWQAYLQGVNLHLANFSHSDLAKSVFAETLDNVFTVAFSPDGRLLATGDAEGVIRLWRVTDGKPLFVCKGHMSWVWSVTFSPDGQTLASGSNDQTLKLWEVSTGECHQTLQGHTGLIFSVAFSPDGQTLASGSSDRTIKLWDVRTGQRYQTLQGHAGYVRSVAFSPDGYTLASGSWDKRVRLWDVTTGQCLKTLRGHTNPVESVGFGSNGQTLASGSQDQTVRLWEVSTGQCYQTLQGHTAPVLSIAFNPYGTILASGSSDYTVKLWDVRVSKCLKTLPGHTNRIWSVAFSPKGHTLASGGEDQRVKLWEVTTGQCLKTLRGHTTSVFSITFSPDGSILASGAEDQRLRLWNIRTGQCYKTWHGHTTRVLSVTFSPNGQLLASSSSDGTVKLWNSSTGQCLKTLQGHTAWVWSIAFSPDECTLASGSLDQTIKLWDASTGECLNTLRDLKGVWCVAFSPNGHTLASGGEDHTVKLWDIRTGQCLKTLGHTNTVISIAFSPDGSLLASGSVDQTVKLWDIRTGQCLKSLQGHTELVWSVAFSPDGSTLASSSFDRTVRLWNVTTGQCLKTLQEHTSGVSSVAFNPIGINVTSDVSTHSEAGWPQENHPLLASSSLDETIKFWDVKTGECLKTLRAERPCEDMNITGATGLTEAQKATLKVLGAVELV